MQLSDVAITDVATGGDGIGHAPDGRIAFVAGAVVGDRVDVAVTEEKPRMLRGVVADVVEASGDRVTPPCPHVAEGCGGCGWQHLAVDAQRQAKIRLAEESLRRIGHLDGTVRLGPGLPATGYRNTVRMVVDGGRLGFRAAHSHDVVAVDACLVSAPAIDEMIAATGPWPRLPDGTEVTLRTSMATGEQLVLVDGVAPDGWFVPGAETAIVSKTAGRRAPSMTERVHGVDFRVSIGSFFQTRTDGAAALVDVVGELGGDAWGSGHLVDLYGGVGLFAGCLGGGMSVTLVESAPSSVADARHNLPDASVIARRAEQWVPSDRDMDARVVVADPPRAGLHRDVIATLARIRPAALVVVHCDAASFGRDAGRLVAAGFQRDDTVLVDLFPHTPHVELVSRFSSG